MSLTMDTFESSYSIITDLLSQKTCNRPQNTSEVLEICKIAALLTVSYRLQEIEEHLKYSD